MASIAKLVAELDLDGAGLEKGLGRARAALGGFGKVMAVGLAATAVAGVGVGVALFKVGDAYDSMSDSIAIKTGATGDALKSLQDDAINVFKTVPTTMQIAGDAIASISAKTGDTGKNLEDLTSAEIALAQVTGTDLNSNIDASTKLFNSWDIAAKDQTKTLDGLFNASQKYGVGVDELMGQVQQFTPSIKAMGLTMDQGANFIGKIDKAGGHVTLIMKGMTRETNTLKKSGIDVKQGLTDVYAAIKNAGSEAEANTIAVKAFGKASGPELEQMIRNGTLSVEDFTGAVDENGKSIVDSAKGTYDFAENFTLFKNNIEAALIPLGTLVFQGLNLLIPLLTDGVKWLGEIGPKFQGVADYVTQFAHAMIAAGDTGTRIKDLVEFLPPGLQTLEHGFLLVADAIGDVVRGFQTGGLAGAFDALGPALVQAAQGLGSLISAGLSDLGGLIGKAIDAIDWSAVGVAFVKGLHLAWTFAVQNPGLVIGFAVGGPLGAAIGAVLDAIGWENLGTHILTGLQTAFAAVPWPALGDAIFTGVESAVASVPWGDIWAGAKGIVGGLFDAFQNADYHKAGQYVGEGLRAAVLAVAPTIGDVGGTIIESLLTGLQNNWQTIAKWLALWPVLIPAAIGEGIAILAPKAAEFIAGFLSGLGVNWDGQIAPWLASLPQLAIGAIGDLSQTLYDAGTALITGLYTIANNTWTYVVAPWLASIPQLAIDGAGDLATTLYDKGTALVQGLWDGANDLWSSFADWLGGRGDSAIAFVGDLGSTLVSAGSSLIEGLWDGAGDVFDSFTNWLSGIAGDIVSWVGNLGGILYQAGSDAVEGLIQGAMDRIPGLQTTVDILVGIWKQIPALGHSPWPMMIDAAHDAMDGLIIGTKHRMPALNDTIGGIIDLYSVSPNMRGTASFTSAMSGLGSTSSGTSTANSFGGITINVYPTGDPKTNADEVFAAFAREIGLRSA